MPLFDRKTFLTQAVAALSEQSDLAYNPRTGTCAYRTEAGLGCAIGVMIPDDRYDPEMDNRVGQGIARNTPVQIVIQDLYGQFGPEDLGWLSHLQEIHDNSMNHETMVYRMNLQLEKLNG